MISTPIPTSHKYPVIDIIAALAFHEYGDGLEPNMLCNAHASFVEDEHIMILRPNHEQPLTLLILNTLMHFYHTGNEIFVAKFGAACDVGHVEVGAVLINKLILILLILKRQQTRRHITQPQLGPTLSYREQLFKKLRHGLHFVLLARLGGFLVILIKLLARKLY